MVLLASKTAARDSKGDRLRIYAAVIVVLFVLAVAANALARNNGGISGCTRLIQQASEYDCLSQIAVSTGNVSICSLMNGTYMNTCYYAISLNNTRTADCAVITNSSLQGECYYTKATETQNYSLCRLSGAYSSCIMNISLSQRNVALCGSLQNSSNTSVCSSIIYMYDAVKDYKPSGCMKVSNNSSYGTYSSILYGFNRLYASNSDINVTLSASYLSAYLQGSISARSICYFISAYNTKNVSVCGNIGNVTVRNYCGYYANISAYHSNGLNYTQIASECSSNSSASATCNASVALVKAITNDNATLCGTLGQAYSGECYFALAQKLHNPYYCGFISNTSENEICVYSISYNQSQVYNGTV